MVGSGAEFSQREFDYAYHPGIERHFWTVARSRVIVDAIKSLPDRGERILEIGCGRVKLQNAEGADGQKSPYMHASTLYVNTRSDRQKGSNVPITVGQNG